MNSQVSTARLAGMALPLRLVALEGEENRGLIDAEGRLIADFNAACEEDLGLPEDYARNAQTVAALLALVPRIEKALRDALTLRSLECCLTDGRWPGNRRAVRAEASAIETRIGDVLKSLERISQIEEGKETAR